MADPIVMKSDELVRGHVDAFVDANGNPQAVDSFEWRSLDTNVCTVEDATSMDFRIVATDMLPDAPMQTTVVELHVTEAGVVDAFVIPFDVMVSSLNSPSAVGANITFGAPEKKVP